jgi:predicted ATPase
LSRVTTVLHVTTAEQTMIKRVKLYSLEIKNYLGAGEGILRLQLDGNHAVLCGPNGSGKTTLLSALDRLRRINWTSAMQSWSQGRNPSQVTLWEWFDARPHLTAQLFHTGSYKFEVCASFLIPSGVDVHRRLEPIVPVFERALRTISVQKPEASAASVDPIRVAYGIVARNDQKAKLEYITIDDREVFRLGQSTKFASLVPPGQQTPEAHRYDLLIDDPRDMFEPFKSLLDRIVYFPSSRQPRVGFDGNAGWMAGGEGLVTWLSSATNPDPRNAESELRHNLLQAFEYEFADFIGCQRVSLSVPQFATPPQNNEQPEINVTLDGRVRLISQLGAGIGESLIIMLIAKLSQEWHVPLVDILLLEEPELHIHPTMQRKLLDRLADSGVQLIATTHSPTVLNWFVRNSGRVFRTEFEETDKRTTVKEAHDLAELRDLLASIGASPADVLLADKVLLVEGPNDIPVYQAFLGKAPSLKGQNIPVLSLGGTTAAGRNFDASLWANLHPKIWAVLDSERRGPDKAVARSQSTVKSSLEAAGIPCHLTELRATENYLTPRALKVVYRKAPAAIDPFGDPNLATKGVKQFDKRRNGEVARAMEWHEVAETDIGIYLERFLQD